jgi:hypothetical protein
LVLAAILLGISIHLINGQIQGSAPSLLVYLAIIGGILALSSTYGLCVTFIPFFSSANYAVWAWLLDIFTTVLLLAGGIAAVIQLKDVSCTDWSSVLTNPVLGCGARIVNNRYTNGCLRDYPDTGSLLDLANAVLDAITGRCKEGRAGEVVTWIAVVAGLLLVGLEYKENMNKKASPRIVRGRIY